MFKRTIMMLALVTMAIGCAKQIPVKSDCWIGTSGHGACAFTNTNDDEAAKCTTLYVWQFGTLAHTEPLTVCSGKVPGLTTLDVKFTIADSRELCRSGGGQWSEVCTLIADVPVAKMVGDALAVMAGQ